MRSLHWDKNGLKHGAWSPEEDELLISYIRKYKIWNWSHMPKFAGLSRSGKSCRLRWMNYLRPDLKRGNITDEEEEIIVKMFSQMGSRWSKIAARLPGRTDNEIKNYWHTHLKGTNEKSVPRNIKHKRESRIERVAAETITVDSNESIYTSTPPSEGSNESSIMTYIAFESSSLQGSQVPQEMISSNYMPIELDFSSYNKSLQFGFDVIQAKNDVTSNTSTTNNQQVLVQPRYEEPENIDVFNKDHNWLNILLETNLDGAS